MASDWTPLGPVHDIDGNRVDVSCHVSGAVALERGRAGGPAVVFPAAERDTLRELLDRAAMPGQVPPVAEAEPTAEQVRRCDDSEDPYHSCRVCFDYAANDYRPVRLTAVPGA